MDENDDILEGPYKESLKPMNKFAVAGAVMALLAFAVPSHAGKPLVAEAPINSVGAPETVTVTSYTWTAAPTTDTAGRVGIYVVNKATNTLYGTLSASAPTQAVTVWSLQFFSTDSLADSFVPVSDAVNLYLVTSDPNQSRSAVVQEVKK